MTGTLTLTDRAPSTGTPAADCRCTHGDHDGHPYCDEPAVVLILVDGEWLGDAACRRHKPRGAVA